MTFDFAEIITMFTDAAEALVSLITDVATAVLPAGMAVVAIFLAYKLIRRFVGA